MSAWVSSCAQTCPPVVRSVPPAIGPQQAVRWEGSFAARRVRPGWKNSRLFFGSVTLPMDFIRNLCGSCWSPKINTIYGDWSNFMGSLASFRSGSAVSFEWDVLGWSLNNKGVCLVTTNNHGKPHEGLPDTWWELVSWWLVVSAKKKVKDIESHLGSIKSVKSVKSSVNVGWSNAKKARHLCYLGSLKDWRKLKVEFKKTWACQSIWTCWVSETLLADIRTIGLVIAPNGVEIQPQVDLFNVDPFSRLWDPQPSIHVNWKKPSIFPGLNVTHSQTLILSTVASKVPIGRAICHHHLALWLAFQSSPL